MEVMTMSEKQSNEQVEAFLNKESQWQEEYKYLRALIFNETELEEAYKWMHPCYTLNNKKCSTYPWLQKLCCTIIS